MNAAQAHDAGDAGHGKTNVWGRPGIKILLQTDHFFEHKNVAVGEGIRAVVKDADAGFAIQNKSEEFERGHHAPNGMLFVSGGLTERGGDIFDGRSWQHGQAKRRAIRHVRAFLVINGGYASPEVDEGGDLR